MYSLYPNKDIQAIPNNYEKFMSFKIGEFKFIDSFQFMASSNGKLTEHSYTTEYKPFFYCEDKDKEHMEQYLEYMQIFEPETFQHMYKKEKEVENR